MVSTSFPFPRKTNKHESDFHVLGVAARGVGAGSPFDDEADSSHQRLQRPEDSGVHCRLLPGQKEVFSRGREDER